MGENKKNKVAILRIGTRPSYEEVENTVKRLFDLLGGIRAMVPSSTRRVFVKPAIAFPEKPETGMGTHPEAVCAVAKLLRDAGLDVFIGEGGGTGTGKNTQKHFEVNGLAALTAKMGIPLVDLKQTETVEVPVPHGVVVKAYHIAKPVLEADFRVSVPVIKTHCEATMTLSMKNMKGCLPIDDEKSRMHSIDLNSHLVDLNTLLKPHLSVVDGIVGLMGYGPGRPGIAMNLGLMLAGTAALSVDATCARIVGYEPRDVEHLKLAEERGLGTTREEDIQIVGLPLSEAFFPNFVRPPRGVEGISTYPNVKIIDEGGCSSCITELAYVLETWVPKEKQRDGRPLTIVMGRNVDGKYGDNVVAMGKCTRPMKGCDGVNWLPGCPPNIRQFVDAVKKQLGYENEPDWKPPFADE